MNISKPENILSLIHIYYNGKLKSAEILLKENGDFELIRRAETPKDYFATFDCFDILKDMKDPYQK